MYNIYALNYKEEDKIRGKVDIRVLDPILIP